MDKIAIKFFSDILFAKEIINIEEYENIMEARNPSDLDDIFEQMLRGEIYNVYK